ncbi:DUF3592 domain-containing protein [Micromonospora sp. NPDC051296]|uniref:DUF3592 domain-containing protein n=1 Tax=Micromonospora sp. NPDC051296 TaxID=3155046 RepID=UPI0034239946
MAHDNYPPAAARWVRVLRRGGLILFGLVGLVFLTVGGLLLVSQSWDRATGTVQECTTRVERTAGTTGRTVQTCTISWQAADGPHTAPVDIGGSATAPGQSVELRVNGDNVALATPGWVGAATAAGGLAMAGTAAVLLVRQHRRTRSPGTRTNR